MAKTEFFSATERKERDYFNHSPGPASDPDRQGPGPAGPGPSNLKTPGPPNLTRLELESDCQGTPAVGARQPRGGRRSWHFQ